MKNLYNTSSRKNFLINMAGASAAIALAPLVSWNYKLQKGDINRIVKGMIAIDTHNHIDVPLSTNELPGPFLDLTNELKTSGFAAICMTFAVDYQKLSNTEEAYDRFTNGLNAMDIVLNQNHISRALNYKDIENAFKNNQPIVIQSVEGGHFLEGQLNRLTIAYKRGLRHLTLLHDSDASVPLGDVYTNAPNFGGLTPFGIDVIKECNRLGIVIDLTHCSNEAINIALKTSKHPMIISHTGLETQLGQDANMARMMKPRLISKEQAKIFTEAGGIIGVWTHLSATPLEYAKNIQAMVNLVGVDHVCIGTDTKLTPAYRGPAKSESNNQEVRIGERTNLSWKDQKEGFLFETVKALLEIGFKENEIKKIASDNYLNLFKAITS
jgi:membrane dipeptidase